MTKIRWLNAVRVIGLVLVLGYHLFYNALPAGFFGVDVFFTLSGYLIVALIIEEIRKSKKFGALKFFRKRFNRIVPPLFFSIAFTIPLTHFISNDFTINVARRAAAAMGFVTNWFEILTQGSYEAELIPSLYVHTWSLSVEVQFYIIAGILCLVFSHSSRLFAKDDGVSQTGIFKLLVAAFFSAIGLASFLTMRRMFGEGGELSPIYFNTLSRIFAFCIGAISAVAWGVRQKEGETFGYKGANKKRKIFLIALTSLAAAAAAALVFLSATQNFNEPFVYRYGFLLASLLTSAMIFGARALHLLLPEGKNEPKALTVASDLSYYVFLFHWPLYIIFSALIFNNTLAALATLATAFAVSALFFYVVERVFVPAGAKGCFKHKKIAVAIFSAALAASIAAVVPVFYRAPAITSIEVDFAVSYVYYDKEQLRLGMNAEPMALRLLPEETSEYFPDEEAASRPDEETAVDHGDGDPGADMPGDTPENNGPDGNIVTEVDPDGRDDTSSDDDGAPDGSEVKADGDAAADGQQQTVPPADGNKGDQASSGTFLNVPGGVTVIGDSVALGAAPTILSVIEGSYVDAAVSRHINEGHNIMVEMQEKGTLGEYVVIALGTNGNSRYESLMTQIIESLAPGRKMIFVTPFDGRNNNNANWVSKTAEWIRGLPAIYDFVTVADWNALIAGQVNLLAGDKVHMGGRSSMNLYAECLAEAINEASSGPAK
ncbi:MAG: acyltransferase family protein [Defluviitaleaceae bacterium]|nr:acyltransferase family protein [Defluviitaleaceae bacterium]